MTNAFDTLVASLSPAAWWKLADAVSTTSPVDSSGNSHTATATGTTTFGSTGSALAAPNTSLLLGGAGSVSFSPNPITATPTAASAFAIFNTVYTSALQSVLDIDVFGSGILAIYVVNSSGVVGFACGSGFNTPTQVNTTGVYNDGLWHMAVFTWDGTKMRGYMDGAAAIAATTPSHPLAWGGVTPVYLGTDSSGDHLHGSLQECALFNSTLTPANITALFNANVAVGGTNLGWQAVLNQLAGTTNLGELAAANAYAGTSNLGLLAALNVKAGTKNLGLDAVCNSIAGTTGNSALAALNRKAGNANP